MLRSVFIFLFVAILLHSKTTFSQDSASDFQELDTTASVKRILEDTLIANHHLLTTSELQKLNFNSSFSVYGEYINEVLKKGQWFKLRLKPEKQLFVKRQHSNKDWLFYLFSGMFFFIGIVNTLYANFISKLIRGYVNEGFIFFQTKEQLSQYPMPSFLMNLFFFLTGTFFTFFWLTLKGMRFPVDRWQLLLLIFLILVLVYLFKFIFIHALGWLFNDQELFSSYVFIVFLNNKIVGLILFIFSFVMAFTNAFFALAISKIAFGLLVIAFLFRFFKAFAIFSKQAKLSLFTFIVAVLSLEVVPTAVIIKFIFEGFKTV